MRNFSFPIFPKTLSLLTVTLLLLVNSGIQAQVLEKNNPVPTPQNVPPTQNAPTLPKKLNWRESGNKKGVTFGEYQAAFYKDWQGRKPKKGEGFKPFKRWEDMMAPRVYPSGDMTLPATTYNNFMEWEKNQAVQDSRARTSTTLSTTGNWTELGPLSKPAGYDAGVGRIDFVRFDPTNPSIMYVCSPDGGLWKSVNGGTSWTTNTDFLPIIGCADLVIDPTNTQIMYLATGNREFDRNSIGILKSTDGGTTWSPTALTIPTQNGWTIRRLIMDPTNPQVMIAVLNVGVFRTTDGWATRTVPGSIANKNLEDAEFKPGDPNTVYAAGKEFYKSTDKGVTWTKITSGLPAEASVSRALIAVTAANPDYVYAVYGNADGGYLGTYRSTDSGTSFTAQSTLASLNNNILNCDTLTTTTSGQASHNLAIVVSPTNADSVSIGGCNVWQSGDGGTTWTLSSFWLGNDPAFPGINPATPSYVHADIQSLDYRPGSSSVLFVTSDGGISKSTTGGNRKWTDISNNLSVAQMTNVGQSSLTPLNMIAGLQDIGTLKNSNGSWFVTNGGDGEDGFIDRTNDNTIITSNPNGQFALSTDAGVTKADITGLPPGTEFFSPIHQDPTDATLVYAGGRTALYKSNTVLTDPAAAWTALGTPVGTGGITRFEIAPSNNQVIYALKFNALSKSTDGGSSFTNITGVLPISQALPTNLCVSNTDPNKVWVTFSGYTAGEKVYRTTDGGTTWINISAGLPNIPMNTIVYTNNSPTDALYLGADIGVYYMDNATPWQQFKTGLPNSIVRDMEIYYPTSKIRAATYGRGLWESDLYTAVVCVKPDAGKDSTYACVNNQLPTALDLKDAQAGQKWKVGTIPSGSSVAVLTPSGNVSGTFVAGAYQFILQTQSDSLNCRDTVVVTLQACACVKPDAGKDSTYACIARNLPTAFDLKDALAGQKWKIISPVPPGASISIASPSGMVSGTIVAGTYNFALQTQSDSIACRDTVKITVTPCPCTKPNAGPDQTLACSGIAQPTGADLVDAKVGEKWKILTIPPGANIKVTTPAGLVTPNSPTTSLPAGLYQFVLQNQSDSLTCRDTVNVTVPNCTPVCVQPTRLVTATNPTCTTMGKVELTSTSGDKYGISNGGTYTGPAYATATAVPGSLPAIIKNTISNTADSIFTIRLFNLANDCFKDTTVTVKAAPVKPTVMTAPPLCRANGTTYTIKFTATDGTVTTVPSFPVTGDSIAGIPIATASVKLIVTSADGCENSVTVMAPNCATGQIALKPSAYLQGALYGVLSPSILMRDDLRIKGFLPRTSPYPGMGMTGLTTTDISSDAVVGPTSPSGTDAIVDWVFIELRSASDSVTVVDSRSALIQRDGDIVDVDGTSSLNFSVAPAGNYFVVVRHRNHLSVMSKTAIALSTISLVEIDFRQASTPTYNIDLGNPNNIPQATVPPGAAMWAGNVLYTNLSDGKHNIIFQGNDNDVNVIYQQVINSPINTLLLNSFKLKGYYTGDVTMDGETISQGAGNETEFIYQNIINNHPGNAAKLFYFKIKEQTK